MRIADFRVLSFDCYGTLIDWESGMTTALAPLVARAGHPDRDAVLAAHARHESEQQAQTPAMRYADLLAVVHRRLAEDWGVPAPWEESLAYGASVGDWPAFPDSAEALAYLKRHFRLVILSNVDNRSFAASNARLGVTFDAICTAEDIGAYKPSQRAFDYLLARLAGLGVARHEVLHVAESLFHDHLPANRHGLANAWIHRRHAAGGFGATRDPGEMPRIGVSFTSMAALAEAHRAELAAG